MFVNARVGLLAIVCLSFLGLLRAESQSREIALRQFQHTRWTLQDGAPSQINALAQTTDGYLWIGTVNGLFRFDGVKFEAYQPPAHQHLSETSIQTLTATADGGLWIGYTFGDIDYLKNGRLQDQRFAPDYSGATVYSIIRDHDGGLWAATIDGLLHVVNGVWSNAEETKGLKIASCYFLSVDSKGALWLTTDGMMYRLPHGARKFESTEIRAGAGSVTVEGPGGNEWITDSAGIAAFTSSSPVQQSSSHIKIPGITTALQFDPSGALWVLGAAHGITRIPRPKSALELTSHKHDLNQEQFTAKDGLTSDNAMAALSDREGNIWIATPAGLDRFRRTVFDPAPLPISFGQYALAALPDGSLLVGTQFDGLQKLTGGRLSKVIGVPLQDISCIYRAPDGKLWLGGKGDLGYLQDNTFHSVPVPPNIKLVPRDTQAITTGPDGEIWLQVAASGESFLKLHAGHWEPVVASRPKYPTALTLVSDHAGRVWGGYRNGIVRVFEHGDSITRVDKNGGITVGNVTAIYDSGSHVWIGGEHGMQVMLSGRPTPVRFSGNTPIEGVSGIIQSHDGAMWINALPGVLRVSAKDVSRFLKDQSYPLRYELFNYLDGLSAKAPQMRPLPSITEGVGNTLWFTTTNGAFSIDTASIYRNSVGPPVSITGIAVDGTIVDTHKSLQLPKGAQNLNISYSALSLSMPERVLFRYRLEGYDNDWQDAGTRREAFYSQLPPGHYVFRVIACNNDGVWNMVGASLPLSLPPTFMQSWYFKILAVVLALLALRLIVVLRTRQAMAKSQARLAERFNERQRLARDLHDTFFQGVQGLLLHVQNAARRLHVDDPARRSLEETLKQSDGVMLQGRELLLNLRTAASDINELPTRLQASAAEFSHLYPSEFELKVTGKPIPLETVVCDELSKLGREALCNAYQHAQAKKIEVRLSYLRDALHIGVHDNGIGIDPQTLSEGGTVNHWGLPGMRERAAAIGASFEITSTPGGETAVQVAIPAGLAYQYVPTIRRWSIRRLFGERRLAQ